MSKTKSSSSNNTLLFGGRGGDFHSFQDTGGQSVVIKYGTALDSIQIGNVKYGGKGGDHSTLFTLPANGEFQLLELRVAHYDGHDLLTYIKLSCNGEEYEAGTDTTTGKLVLGGGGITVKISGVYSGSKLDAIFFDVINLASI